MSKETILIVEDDGILALHLQDMLSRRGYSVAEMVSYGEHAIDFLSTKSVDLVLMDIELAGAMNGIATADLITKTYDIPIVFLTGFSQDPLLEQAKIAAPYGYLIKPVPESELVATIEIALHRYRLNQKLKESQHALQKSEAKYRHLFENSPLGIFRTTLDGKALAVNREMARIFGCKTPAEAISNYTDLTNQFYVNPDRRHELISLLQKQGAVDHFEVEARNNKGETLWISLNAKLTNSDNSDSSDNPRGEMVIDCFAIDITTRKLAEEKLYQTNAILQAAMDQSPAGIAIADAPDGTLRYVNNAGLFIRGSDRKNIVDGVSLTDYVRSWQILDLDGRPLRTEEVPLARAILFGETNTRKFIVRRSEVDERIVQANAAPIRDKSGAVVAAIVVFNDITEQTKAEEALRESEARLQMAISCSPIPLMIHDEDDRILQLSNGWTKLSGYTLEDIPTLADWTTLAYGEKAGSSKSYIDELFNIQQTVKNGEWPVRAKDGTTRIWDFQTTPLGKINEGRRVLLSMATDITDRIQAEEERKNLQSQLIQAQKMEAIGTLAGGIAHDFNNILGAILGYAEMAREDSSPDSHTAKDLDQIIKAGNRAKELVKQILAFSRQAEAQQIPMQPTAIIKETIRLLRSSLPTTITIEQDIDPATGIILADPTQIHQILMNLSTNAFHAMEEKGGTLTVSLKMKSFSEQDMVGVPGCNPGNYVQLSIADTGGGISPEILGKIFDPYFTTKETGKGTGMGLSIVHGIVKSYGGFITCHSRIGQGTVFHISLPAMEKEIMPVIPKPIETTTASNERILFIDDESMLAEMAQRMLSRIGYTVTVRTSSLEALNTFENHPDSFDLVITDQTMPGMTGIDLARRMLQIRPHLPIILCTGYSSLISEEKARSAGIKGFALKPLARNDITSIIKKVLGQKNKTDK